MSHNCLWGNNTLRSIVVGVGQPELIIIPLLSVPISCSLFRPHEAQSRRAREARGRRGVYWRVPQSRLHDRGVEGRFTFSWLHTTPHNSTSESLCALSLRSTSFSRLRLLNSSLNPFSKSSRIFSVSLHVHGYMRVQVPTAVVDAGKIRRGGGRGACRGAPSPNKPEAKRVVTARWFLLGRRFVRPVPAVQKSTHDVLPAGDTYRRVTEYLLDMQMLVAVYESNIFIQPTFCAENMNDALTSNYCCVHGCPPGVYLSRRNRAFCPAIAEVTLNSCRARSSRLVPSFDTADSRALRSAT